MTKENALTKSVDLNALKETNPDLYNRLAEEYKRQFAQMGKIPKLARIKISHGHKTFNFPDDSVTKELVGVVLSIGYFKEMYDESLEGTNPPVCASINSDRGFKYGECSKCKYYEWGSGKNGKGRACQDSRRIVIAIKGHPTPFELKIPATSSAAFDKAVSNAMATFGLPYQLLNIHATLKVEGEGANSFSVVEAYFEKPEELTEAKMVGRLDGAAKYKTYFEDAYGMLNVEDTEDAIADKQNDKQPDDGGASDKVLEEEAEAKKAKAKSKKKSKEEDVVEEGKEVAVDELPV